MNLYYYKSMEDETIETIETIESISNTLQELNMYDKTTIPENNVGQIYMVTNKTSGMSYIGQTKSLRWHSKKWRPYGYYSRWSEHLNSAIRNENKCTALANAIRECEYEKDNWDLILLYECKLEDRDIYEKEFIKKHNTVYPNGYNLTGGGKTDITVSDETRKNISLASTKVWQREGIVQRLSDTQSDNNDLAKIERLKKCIEYISICKIDVNTCFSRKEMEYDLIVLRFYDINSKAVVIAGEDNNKITYGGSHINIIDALQRVILFLNSFKPLQIEFLNKNLEAKYNEIMQDDSLDVEENVSQEDNITQKFGTTRLDKNDLKKIKKVEKYIENIKICKININSDTGDEGVKYDIISLRFYNGNHESIIISGKNSNRIKYGGVNVSDT
jgi:hypothetical protein